MVDVTAFYAALTAALFLVLSVRVIAVRRSRGVALGAGQDPDLLQRVRAQANCAEYAPIALLLILIVELQGAHAALLHALGLLLVVGRALHAASLWRRPQNFTLRVAGMSATFAAIALAALTALALAALG